MSKVEPVVTVKFTQTEIDRLVDALIILKTMIIPVESEWKQPYKTLLKDLEEIKIGIADKVHEINIEQPELLEWKRTGNIGCKSGNCE